MSTCNFRYSMPKEILVMSRSGSNFDFHLTIKHFANELEDNEFKCFGENTNDSKKDKQV